jgi:hypothetical protein
MNPDSFMGVIKRGKLEKREVDSSLMRERGR